MPIRRYHLLQKCLPKNISSTSRKFSDSAKVLASNFIQDEPQHENSYLSDAFLRRWMKTKIPCEIFRQIEPDLIQFGDRARNDIWKLGEECESNPPFLKYSKCDFFYHNFFHR